VAGRQGGGRKKMDTMREIKREECNSETNKQTNKKQI
jgi:hypothetical protein